MAYKFREDIVGKRFLSVSGFTKLKLNKVSEWGWRSGVIRAASHRDNNCQDLQVLVEYDDVEWQRREWLSPHRDAVFSFFLIEKGLCWAERPDPRHTSLIAIDHHNHSNNNHHLRINGKSLRGTTAAANTVAWPAITFYPLVARAELPEESMPVEFMQDRRLDFVDYSKLKAFTQDWELTKGSTPWGSAVRRWAEMQDGQKILLTTPSVLVGFRVEVYRAEGTTQWYTAVIVGYNESTKDLTVTDDTVLEDHNEDPSLVQMRLIGDGVVESIMRGEVVGMTPRRSRSSTGLTHTLVMPRPGRRPRGRPVNAAQLQPSLRTQSPVSQQLEKDKGNTRGNRRRRNSESASREKGERTQVDSEEALSVGQEDRENKGPSAGRPGNRTPRTVLEEANPAPGSLSKLRRRGTTVKSPVESLSQRPVRKKPRPGGELKLSGEYESEKQQLLVKDDKKERLECRSDDEGEVEKEDRDEEDECCDPLIKRLKANPTLRKTTRSEKKDFEREIQDPVDEKEHFKQLKKEVVCDGERVENEESQSRERDREPEPPPTNNLDSGRDTNLTVKSDPDTESSTRALEERLANGLKSDEVTSDENKRLGCTSPINCTKSSKKEEERKEDDEEEKEKSRESSAPGRPDSSVDATEDSGLGSSARAASVESVELLESSSQDSSSVLERLSPLPGGRGRQSLLLEEQERSRHNESPVILAERLNKPPPPISSHHLQYHHHQSLHHQHRFSTGSPVIHQQHLQIPGSPHHHHLTSASLLEVQQQSLPSQGGDEAGLMEVEAGAGVGIPGGGVLGGVPAAGTLRTTTYGDSGSDSGVSSLRSAGSGDERSGSRSSALSAEETAPAATPARVWHVQSVQHTSLLMAHPQGPPNPAASSTSSTVPPLGYQSSAPPGHHHPVVATEMLWRPPRYPPPLPHALLAPSQPSPEELLERDRHERMLRERREAEVRELEKREREREREAKMERERLEKQRAAEQAVHKHFEESLRLAQQKRNMQSASMAWNSFIPLPPPGSRTHGTPHGGLTPHGHHHPGAVSAAHPVTVAQQQQREREEREARERDRDAAARDREQREREHLAAAERLHRQADVRDHAAAAHQRAAYYAATVQPTAQQVSRPSSVPGKVEYPPPAHSRTSKSSLTVSSHHEKSSVVGPPHSVLPKAEPNVSLFGYSTYQPQSYMHEIKVKSDLQSHKQLPGKSANMTVVSHERDHHGREIHQNPPPLMSDQKSSVIVKNEGRELPKAPTPQQQQQQHSPSLKMMSYMNVQPVTPQHKPSGYEYRSPTQSPHHHHHHMESIQAKNIPPSHHRPGANTGQLPSPHGHPAHPHNRQSPHAQHPHQPHPTPPEPRYLSRPGPEPGIQYGAKSAYSYPHPPTASSTTHYAAPPAGSKPKVSSPAPSHIYGKPNSGIMTGTPVCRASDPGPVPGPLPLTSKAGTSPYQQVPHHHGAPPLPLPPPAHSSRSVYDSRGGFAGAVSATKLPPPPLHTSPSTAASAPMSARAVVHPSHHSSPHHQTPVGQSIPPQQSSSMSTAFQTQPLDLGVERTSSPKRKAPTPSDDCINTGQQPVSLEVCKKRRVDEPQPLSLQSVCTPVLSRVSEPSPLIASAATSITTVVNTALLAQPTNQSQVPDRVVTSVSPAPRAASGDELIRPSSTGSVSSLNPTPSAAPSPAPIPSPAPVPSPAPSVAPSPAPSAPGTPAKANSSTTVDSEKSNSPAPRPPSSTKYPVHKLKKAWLQRHSGEDGTEDTTGVVGSGSCVTLPLNIAQAPSQPLNNKERETTTSTSLPSAVNSIHNIGSMAVNSINKTKVTGKSGRKPVNKETVNGHATDTKSLQEDSSSSDPERKSPPKRKPPKVKRKKGAARKQQAVAEDHRRRKDDKQGGGGPGAGSESSNESEAGSVSDTSEQLGSVQPASRGRHTAANSNNSSGNGTNKEPRKRGRRPKTSKGSDVGEEQQPRSKKERRDDSTGGGGGGAGNGPGGGGSGKSDPFRKPSISQLKKTGESWLQDGNCCEVAPKLAKCRECRMTPHQRSKNLYQNIFCRFYAFRKLRFTKNGQLAIAGFSDPHKDASDEDLWLWSSGKSLAIKEEKPDKNEKEKEKSEKEELDLEMAYRLLCQVGDQFCDLLHQEKDALQEHMVEASSGVVDGTVAWKRVVQGVREMCDVCETTLFNYHWACGKCGFVVCIDCYKGRKNGTVKIWGESGKDRDDFSWLLCTNRQVHEPARLMLTQIIAGDSLVQLGQRLHECRCEWGIPQYCNCSVITQVNVNEVLRNLIKGDSLTIMNGNVKQESKEGKKIESNGSSENKTNGEDKNSPLNWLADVALQNEDKNDSGSSSDSDEDRDGNYSTLRELLIRPNQSNKSNGSGSRSNSPTNNTNNSNSNSAPNATVNNVSKSGKKSKMDTLDEVISSVIEHSVKKEKEGGGGLDNDEKPRELKHFVRRYKWTQRGREPLPIRIMTLTESKSLYPDVPHAWLCDGKLLRLNDPNNPNNYRIFQDQWKRGQPVIVSDVAKALDKDLWHPDSFGRDFGDEKNDLVNCMTGNLVPNQPMRKFWEGFETFSKRLKDDRGNPMLLKLKDWPPGEDFAELLPSRYADLMKALPLSEYTHRTGRLNLASRLPECFVRPDLGPKMYNAYGSALHPNKGTTNLHLDISDAVNVMVYVGIPKDGDNDEHIKEALRAVDEAGCDILTRRRVRERGEAPGALWHIYPARDADKIRDLLNAVALERGARLEPHHDPIHDQSFYLDGPLRERLYRDYGVEGYAIVQCLGDAVFVPAGAPHQVRNLHNCIKVAEDFVSPENVSHCFHLTQEFRALSDTHSNHEDKLQIKNIIYHAVKDSLTVLSNAKDDALSKTSTNTEVKVKDET
ncbi:probable JmjC domain-containing histone demethylation protein 2C isoform X3 [Leptopilina boulardi]|uniref:probable JmjC domain-containing histone demethylation protein 2C isoform X3 n=1 Tax=Leptopilina boulardi TaxID=63433 RepID=UPI0021F5DB5B|nr:probable JmjC domain-containing histone demethylation protein 2C isoform X3 [Leptopilina boulardi]